MTTQLSPLPVQRFYDNNNVPLVGGQLYTYIAGTSTPQATYTDSTGGTPNANPVIMNARGEANVWLTPGQTYKFVLKDASSNTIWTVDQVSSPSMTNYLAPATGAVSRTITSKLYEFLSVKDFGAAGDGVTDDTVAIQTATTWAGALGRAVFFPAGSYLYSGISVAAGNAVSFIGESTSKTFLNLSSGTATGFNCATEQPVVFDSLTFQYNGGVTGSSGSFISVPGGATMNANSRFRNLQMNNPWIGINATGAYLWIADSVSIGNYISSGIVVGNTFNGDAGDSTITKCLFSTISTTSGAITHLSSGGLRIINNKSIGGFCFYNLNLASGVNTSDTLITGNSIEGSSSSGLIANRQGVTGTFSNILVSGNQFAGIQFPVNFNNGTVGWLNNVCVSGNIIPVIASGVGVSISAATNFTINGNTFSAANSSTSVAIQVASTASNGTIGANNYSNFTTPISNVSTSTAVSKRVFQATSGTIVCSTAYGSLFTGTVSVTFPAGLFVQSPTVTATMLAQGNAVSAMVSGISVSGCTITGIAFSNGANVAAMVRAEADY